VPTGQAQGRAWRMNVSAAPLRVLLVEDSATDALLTELAFNDHAPTFTLRVVTTGEEGLTVLNSGERVDVLLLDMNLPGMSGADVLREVRSCQRTAHIIAIALLGSSSEEAWWRGRGLHPDAFLSKPANPTDVLAAWRTAGALTLNTPVMAERANE